jgi:hypothetical protein
VLPETVRFWLDTWGRGFPPGFGKGYKRRRLGNGRVYCCDILRGDIGVVVPVIGYCGLCVTRILVYARPWQVSNREGRFYSMRGCIEYPSATLLRRVRPPKGFQIMGLLVYKAVSTLAKCFISIRPTAGSMPPFIVLTY